MTLSLFASCAPGLEHCVHTEVLDLGLSQSAVVTGGVEITTDARDAVRLLLSLRTASHLLLRIARFRAEHFERFERELKKLDFASWLPREAPRRVRATAERSRLYHTNAIIERLERVLDESLGPTRGEESAAIDRLTVRRLPSAPSTGTSVRDLSASAPTAITISARFVKDVCTLSIDLSGEPLHRRGYRLDPGRAPLREDIAAALVMVSGWAAPRPLVDPFCGSGTIAIEAARHAAGLLPGLERGFAMEDMPLAPRELFAEERRSAMARVVKPAAHFFASDRDPRAVDRTRENATRAGVEECLVIAHAPLSELRLGALDHAAVVTNPPWGERIDEGPNLDRLYAALGAFARTLGARTTLAVAAHDPMLARKVGRPLRSAFMTDAGGTKVHAMVSE